MGMIGNSLAQGLISGANIQDGTVDTPDIKDSAVTAAKIASAVVTPAKMDFSAGTANGVLFLNGSKVASSGSGLTLDSSSNLSLLGAFTIGNAGVSSGIINSADSLFFNIDSDNNDGTNANVFAWGRDATTSAATRLMTLDASGNFGIGIVPDYKLHLQGGASIAAASMQMSVSANVQNQISLSNGYGNRQGVVFLGDGSSGNTSFGVISTQQSLTFQTAAYNIGGASNLTTGWTERLRIDSNGHLSTPGNIYFYSYSGGSFGTVRSGFYFDGSGQTLQFFTTSNERARIDSSGNFMVGTTSNSNARFTVTGNSFGGSGVLYRFGDQYTYKQGGYNSQVGNSGRTLFAYGYDQVNWSYHYIKVIIKRGYYYESGYAEYMINCQNGTVTQVSNTNSGTSTSSLSLSNNTINSNHRVTTVSFVSPASYNTWDFEIEFWGQTPVAWTTTPNPGYIALY